MSKITFIPTFSRLSVIALILASSLLSLHIQADTEPVDLFALSLEELMSMELTGSTLIPESINTVPAAVTVFSHQQLKNMGVDSLDGRY